MSYVVHETVEEIKFKKEYYPLIHDGLKTQTLRLARKRLDVREDDICTAIFPGISEQLRIKINKIGYKQFKSITLEDALAEGFNSITDLKSELISIYPTINAFDRLYYYKFELVEENIL